MKTTTATDHVGKYVTGYYDCDGKLCTVAPPQRKFKSAEEWLKAVFRSMESNNKRTTSGHNFVTVLTRDSK